MSVEKLPWFRAYTDMVDDEKLRLLAFEDRWHFIALLCCKSAGLLDSGDDPGLLRRKVAVKLGLAVRELDEAARRLAEVGLIEADSFQPYGWECRQFVSDTDPTARARKRRQRERCTARVNEIEASSNVTDMSRVTVTDVTRTDTDTDTEEAKAKAKAVRAPAAHDLFHDCPAEVVSDFLVLRKSKRAAVTATAVDGLRREAAKAGLPLAEVLRVCCERGWVGFKAHWEWGDGNRQRAGPPAGPSKQLQGVAAILGVDPNDLIERRPGAVVRQPDRPVLGQPVPAQPRRLSSSG